MAQKKGRVALAAILGMGFASFALSQTPPPQIQPAPNNPWGWLDDPYSDVWGAQVGYFVAMHATRGEVIPIPSPNSINPLENVQVVSVAGWQETSPAPRN